MLVDASLEFGASLQIADVLGAAARRMCELAGADQCDFYFLKDGCMQPLVTTDGRVEADERRAMRFDLADYDVSRQAMESRQPVSVDDTATDPRLSDAERADARPFGYRSSVDLPLVTGGEVVGLAVLTSRQSRAAMAGSICCRAWPITPPRHW